MGGPRSRLLVFPHSHVAFAYRVPWSLCSSCSLRGGDGAGPGFGDTAMFMSQSALRPLESQFLPVEWEGGGPSMNYLIVGAGTP